MKPSTTLHSPNKLLKRETTHKRSLCSPAVGRIPQRPPHVLLNLYPPYVAVCLSLDYFTGYIAPL